MVTREGIEPSNLPGKNRVLFLSSFRVVGGSGGN